MLAKLLTLFTLFTLFNWPTPFSPLQAAMDLKKLKLPPHFTVSVFQDNLKNARSLVRGDAGTIFVSTLEQGDVYAVVDKNQDGQGDKVYTLATGLNSPNGVAFKDGDLYVAEINRIIVFRQIEKNLPKPGKFEVIYEQLPSDKHHGWRFIAFGPDGHLYIPVGAPCNVCLKKDAPIFAALHRLDLKTKQLTLVASGIRNTVGFTWHPQTKKLWFTDNGRDLMGDDVPPCELNHIDKEGQHFGFPYLHGKNIQDPEFYQVRPTAMAFTPPDWEFGAHVAPLGVKFYQGKAFPSSYSNRGFFVALHGSWNRSKKSGYKVVFLEYKNGKIVRSEDFMTGFMENERVFGRPVDLLELPNGELLVSDDEAGTVYRVSYKKP